MQALLKLRKQVFAAVIIGCLLLVAAMVLTWVLLHHVLTLSVLTSLIVSACVLLLLAVVAAQIVSHVTLQPIALLFRALDHIANLQAQQPPPKTDDVLLGKAVTEEILNMLYRYGIDQQQNSALLQQHDRFVGATLNLLAIPIFALNNERVILYANQAAVSLLPESIMGEAKGLQLDSVLRLDFTSTDELQSWLEACQATKIKEERVWKGVQLRNEHEELSYVDVHAIFNKNESHNIELLVAIIARDEEYKKENGAVDFISLAVHELRNPITALRGYSEVLREELAPVVKDPEIQEMISRMDTSTQQLATFVNNVLNVTRFENRQLQMHVKPVDWPATIRSIVEELMPHVEARNRKLQLTINSSEPLPPIAIDRVSMHEVLANLVDNAVKYSPPGETISVEVGISHDGTIETVVRDHGIGIPASIIDHLFNKFYRSHRSRENVGGTGLGLYLCKIIIEAHKGTIWVRSKEGEGTVFGFNIPPFSPGATIDQASQIVRKKHGWIKNHGAIRR